MALHDPVNLIISETPLQRFRFGGRTAARAGVAIVVRTSDGQVKGILGQRTMGESLFAPHATEYQIDLSDHLTTFDVQVQTQDGYSFHVAAEVKWRVCDAEEVARRRLTDGAALVTSVLRNRLKEIGRRFGIEQTLEFEQEIRARFLAEDARIVDDCLILEMISPEVRLDAAGAKRLESLREATNNTAIIRAEHENEVLRQRNADQLADIAKRHDLERQRMEREHELTSRQTEERWVAEQRALEAQREELVRRREREWQAEFERREAEARAKFELEQKRLQAELEWAEKQRVHEFEQLRSREFLDAIKQGDAAVLASYLGRNPDEAGKLVDLIVKSQEIGEQRQASLLTDLFNRGLISEADFEGVRGSLVGAFMGMLSRPNNSIFSLNTTVEVSSLLGKQSAAIDRESTEEAASGGDGGDPIAFEGTGEAQPAAKAETEGADE